MKILYASIMCASIMSIFSLQAVTTATVGRVSAQSKAEPQTFCVAAKQLTLKVNNQSVTLARVNQPIALNWENNCAIGAANLDCPSMNWTMKEYSKKPEVICGTTNADNPDIVNFTKGTLQEILNDAGSFYLYKNSGDTTSPCSYYFAHKDANGSLAFTEQTADNRFGVSSCNWMINDRSL